MAVLNKLGFFKKLKNEKEDNEEEIERNTKYPLNELGKYVGDIIEVHYISGDTPKKEKGEKGTLIKERGTLIYPPNDEFFYIGEKEHYHIIYWNRKDNGRKYAVISIKDKYGKTIYQKS